MRTSKKIITLAAFSAALFAFPVQAMEAPAAADAPPAAEGVEEIEVIGQRNLLALRMQVDAAQEQVHLLFNELNTDDDYDIICKTHDRYFSKMKEKVCMPAYAWEIRAEEGRTFADKVQGIANAETAPANLKIDYNEPRLKEQMVEALRHSPELFDAIVKHATLMEELAEAQATYFGDEDQDKEEGDKE
jgi:hypothetical protein